MTENPGIVIEFTGLPNNIDQKLEIAFAANEGPDVFNYSYSSVSNFIANKYIEPLDSYFNTSKVKEVYLPAGIEAVRNIDRLEHKLYGLPVDNNAQALWIRSDWFKETAIPLPVTWDDVFAAIPKLTDKLRGRYGVGLRGGSGGASSLEMLMYSYSGITDYFILNGKCTVNDPLHVEFVEKWLGQYNVNSAEGDIGNGWTELAATFQSGHSAIIAHNLGSASGHNTAFKGDTTKFQAISFPLSKKGTVVHPALSPNGVAISASCKSKQAAFDFAIYKSTGAYESSWTQILASMPLDVNVMKEDWIVNSPWMSMGAQLLLSDKTSFYRNPNYLPSYSSTLVNEVEPMIQTVMAKKMTAKEMLDRWAALMEKIYKEES
jgi:multiple sugar transport system substrate-binding protein